MLSIFKNYKSETSIFDVFTFYDVKEVEDSKKEQSKPITTTQEGGYKSGGVGRGGYGRSENYEKSRGNGGGKYWGKN
jgi:hypothetical protein